MSGSQENRGQQALLTGATGFVGGRLLPVLCQAGYRVRCLARNPDHLRPRLPAGAEVVRGDLLDPASLAPAMEGVRVAWYLVHSLAGGGGFDEQERTAARHFARAAAEAGVRRIVYLGGLGRGEGLSPHLASRQEVGRILREGPVPTVELRASIIIGSGSFSFEMIRALVDRLPVMVTPRWVRRRAQPIAIEDVLEYLLAAAEIPIERSEVFEIGGPDRASYLDIMREYARQRGLRRWMLPVPVLTPRLSSLWLRLVTPLNAAVGRKLIDSIVCDTVVEDRRALEVFGIRPRSLAAAIARALACEDQEYAQTRWSDARSSSGRLTGYGGVRFGSRLVDRREIWVPLPPEQAFAPIQGIGGSRGWYCGNLLWRIRGLIDQILGGVGLRRGRRDPDAVTVGDTIDFWRVEAFVPAGLLRLAAEMRVPGRAWLQFEAEPRDGGTRLVQTAIFDPAGLAGLVYWYALWPIHRYVFAGMLAGIARAAIERRISAGEPAPASPA
mgnify:CR=1 FL=1